MQRSRAHRVGVRFSVDVSGRKMLKTDANSPGTDPAAGGANSGSAISFSRLMTEDAIALDFIDLKLASSC